MLSEDIQSIKRVLAGDAAAFADLVGRYERRLQGLLLHACGSRELAEDISQEAFARAYRKLNLFSGDSQFYTWLARIALNLLASDRRRKRLENQLGREGLEVAIDSFGNAASQVDSLDQSETRECVQHAIAQLDEDRRMVLLLRDFDGMDYDAIAETLDIPIGTVRSRLHRARLDLRSLLKHRAVQLGLSQS
ncbi:MAG: sigma-70 family RNA polymerase sigma factor [Planctomycetales bacterium]|nr:sigma-70 family RNA polymerase sigma factor [Planctomycetales bacterium]